MKTNKVLWIACAVLFSIAVSCSDGAKTETPVKTIGGKVSYSPLNPGPAITDYSFNGTEGDPISLTDAKQWAANYRDKNPGSTQAHFFGSAIIKQILAEPGCVGIRMYYTIDNKGQKQIVLVGADADGNNLLPSPSSSSTLASFSLFSDSDIQNIVADVSWPCPTYCPPNGNGL